MLEFLSAGIVFGLAAGFSPGPLIVLVIAETLRHSLKEGIKVSMAPLITDVPIILISLFILIKLAKFKTVLGCISILGGLFILYLSYESLKAKGLELNNPKQSPNSLKKAVVANALSPHPYIFYMSIGGPIMFKALSKNIFYAVSFIGCFLFFLVGSKVVLALAVRKSRSFIKGQTYIWIMRILGILLIFFSMMLFRDGLRLLDLI
jgi:threonine/homoserine/homoserine lactone efflux protein